MWRPVLVPANTPIEPNKWWGNYASQGGKEQAYIKAKDWNAAGYKTTPVGKCEQRSYREDLWIVIYEEPANEWGEVSP